MRGVHGKHLAQVPLAEDQHPVGDLGPDGQHEAFGEAVRPRTPRRDLDHLDACIRQDRVERCRELSGPIADEEPEPGGCGCPKRRALPLTWCFAAEGGSGMIRRWR